MEQRLFILLILTGFLDPALSVPQAYRLILTPKTWTDAQTYCRTNYIDLATIESAANLTRLQTEAQKYLFSSPAWIGLYRPWRWSMSNETLGAMTFWAPGEPAPVDTRTECAVINKANRGWMDYPCAILYPYVCYDASNPSATRYVYYHDSMTWYDALSFCTLHHTDLAKPTDATENAFIIGIVPTVAWIGLIRDIWRFSDNTSVPVIGWASGQPSNAQINTHCAYFSQNQLANDKCTNVMAFFCNSALPTQQQIVRLNVQSDQDMNDPQVEAQIVQQILNDLMTHGMENVTVKFKKHPDGVVFHKPRTP